jgi:ectoine hydrolase
MAEQSLSALIVTDPANLFYLTGYDAWSFYTPQCLVIPASGELVFFSRKMDADGATSTMWLDPANIEGFPEPLVHRSDIHPFEWIGARIVERGLIDPASGDAIGIEGDSMYFTVRGFRALDTAFGSARLEDSRELVNWVRSVKSEFEINQMRIAGRIAEKAMTAALDGVRVGRRQSEVAAEVFAAQMIGADGHGGTYSSMMPMFPTGARGVAPHLTWNDDVFQEGEATQIEVAGVFERYNVPMTRTVMLGAAPAALLHVEGTVKDGLEAVLAAAKPGVTFGDVHAVWNAIVLKNGLAKESRLGYSIGIGYPPDWGERTFSVRKDDPTVLQAGMCFHTVTWMRKDGWGYMQSESVVVTDTGVEQFSHLVPELTVKG